MADEHLSVVLYIICKHYLDDICTKCRYIIVFTRIRLSLLPHGCLSMQHNYNEYSRSGKIGSSFVQINMLFLYVAFGYMLQNECCISAYNV